MAFLEHTTILNPEASTLSSSSLPLDLSFIAVKRMDMDNQPA